MHKFLKWFALSALILISTPALATWTVTVSTPEPKSWRNGQVLYKVTIALVSDGSDLAEFSLVTEMTTDLGAQQTKAWIERMNGGLLYELVTDPGVAPDSTYTLDFDCERGGSLLDLAALSATVTEHTDFSEDLDWNPVFWGDLYIDIGDIGSNLDAVEIIIYIIK